MEINVTSNVATIDLEKGIYGILAPIIQDKLNYTGAILRKNMQQRIRDRKSPSKPGKSPTNQTGILKDNILYAYDSSSKSVVVGAKLLSGSSIPRKLETGGKVPISKIFLERKFGVGLPGNRGGIGPVVISDDENPWSYPFGIGEHDQKIKSNSKGWSDSVEVIWRHLRTEKEAIHAECTYAYLQKLRKIKPTKKEFGKLEPRPYVGITLEKSQRSIIRIWKNALKKAS